MSIEPVSSALTVPDAASLVKGKPGDRSILLSGPIHTVLPVELLVRGHAQPKPEELGRFAVTMRATDRLRRLSTTEINSVHWPRLVSAKSRLKPGEAEGLRLAWLEDLAGRKFRICYPELGDGHLMPPEDAWHRSQYMNLESGGRFRVGFPISIDMNLTNHFASTIYPGLNRRFLGPQQRRDIEAELQWWSLLAFDPKKDAAKGEGLWGGMWPGWTAYPTMGPLARLRVLPDYWYRELQRLPKAKLLELARSAPIGPVKEEFKRAVAELVVLRGRSGTVIGAAPRPSGVRRPWVGWVRSSTFKSQFYEELGACFTEDFGPPDEEDAMAHLNGRSSEWVAMSQDSEASFRAWCRDVWARGARWRYPAATYHEDGAKLEGSGVKIVDDDDWRVQATEAGITSEELPAILRDNSDWSADDEGMPNLLDGEIQEIHADPSALADEFRRELGQRKLLSLARTAKQKAWIRCLFESKGTPGDCAVAIGAPRNTGNVWMKRFEVKAREVAS